MFRGLELFHILFECGLFCGLGDGPDFMFMTFRHVHSALIAVFILKAVVLAPYPLVSVRASELRAGSIYTPSGKVGVIIYSASLGLASIVTLV